jgi:hypothetical protein
MLKSSGKEKDGRRKSRKSWKAREKAWQNATINTLLRNLDYLLPAAACSFTGEIEHTNLLSR